MYSCSNIGLIRTTARKWQAFKQEQDLRHFWIHQAHGKLGHDVKFKFEQNIT